MRIAGNDYNRAELAGAFGDLGTLVPFVVGYVTLVGLDPQGVLLGFGLVAMLTGLYFRTPLSVQPMKAIRTAAIAHPASVMPGMIWASAVVTGLLWLALAVTGAVGWLATLTSRPVVRGLVLGLGLSFILEGVRFMQQGWVVGVVGAALISCCSGTRASPPCWCSSPTVRSRPWRWTPRSRAPSWAWPRTRGCLRWSSGR